MRNGTSFAEMLDAHLGCTDVPPAAAHVWSNRPLTAPLFAFELPLTAARPAPVEPPRPVHLTSLERQTLDDARTLDALRRSTLCVLTCRKRSPSATLRALVIASRVVAQLSSLRGGADDIHAPPEHCA